MADEVQIEQVAPTGIPKWRLDEVSSQRDEARSKASEYEKQLSQVKSEYESQLAKLNESVKGYETQLSRVRSEYEVKTLLDRDRIDDEDVRESVINLHQKKASDKSFTEWFNEYKATNPALLRPYIGGVVDPGKEGFQTPVQTLTPTVRPDTSNLGVLPNQPPISAFSPQQIARMDTEQYKKHRAEIQKTLNRR
jgi:hypothetical protein